MKKFFIGLCMSLAVGVASAAQAPDELVRSLTEDVLEVLRTEEGLKKGDPTRAVKLIEDIVLPHFNLRRMTMLAVGRDWRDASEDQRQRLIDAFYSMLVRTYSNALTEYSNQTVNYRPLRGQEGRSVRVQTEVRQSGAQPIPVDYMLEKDGDDWKVFDVVIAGVSMVTNYRSTFAQELRSGGIDGLIQALETRGSEIAEKAEANADASKP